MEKKALTIAVAILLIFGIFSVSQYFKLQRELKSAQAEIALVKEGPSSMEVLDFARAFVEKVLRAKGEVSFETRLQLENMVRDLKDRELLDRWNAFVESQTETEAQEQVKLLLSLLLKKI
ncbi:MAG: hypothetical protein HY434_02300 [Candidatus Liptonbacteria bacterium]|nr:hypothetical protein [Candidatus Liptonbacteria bacterium]